MSFDEVFLGLTEQNQHSDAWREFRSKHLGASEIAAVLGESDFQTRYGLWLEKTGQKEPFAGNFATQRGKDAEPVIRELYEKATGRALTAPVLECPGYNFLSASLDGYCAEEALVVEFKYPGKEKHLQALRGSVPEGYRAQLQQQMLVSGAAQADYVSYDGTPNLAIVRVASDSAYRERIIKEAKIFWQHVLDKTPPCAPNELQVEDAELEALLLQHEGLKKQIDEIEESATLTRKKIETMIGGNNTRCAGFRMTYSERKGAVDYGKIEILKNLDLEPYRKKSSSVFTIAKIKGEKHGN